MAAQYRIVPHNEVDGYLRDGWKLYGNPFVNVGGFAWFQAMTKNYSNGPTIHVNDNYTGPVPQVEGGVPDDSKGE